MEKKRILIVNVNWIGDVLFSTPFIKAVRKAHPDSYIACLLHPRCKEMLEGNPRLNEIIIYDEEGKHRSIIGKLKLVIYLRKKGFDAAFILHRSFTKALVVMLAGIRERVGYPAKHRSILLTKKVEEPDEGIHKVEYFLNIARSAGMRPGDLSYEFFISDSDRRAAGELLAKSGVADKDTIVAICPGGNWGPKRWPAENFAALADNLIEHFGARILITGAGSDTSLAAEIEELMKNRAINISGKTTLKSLGAIFEKTDLVVANDTGSMHIAVSMKANVIALFGPTSPGITGPYGGGNYKVISRNDECDVPCYDFTCKDSSCMRKISVDEVLREASGVLARSSKPEAGSENDNR